MKKSFKILSFLLATLIFVAAITGCDLLPQNDATSGESTGIISETLAETDDLSENSSSETQAEVDETEQGSQITEGGFEESVGESDESLSATESATEEETEQGSQITEGGYSESATESVTEPVVESTESTSATESASATEEETEERIGSISILNGSEITISVGDSVRLTLYKSSFIKTVGWSADSRIAYVDDNGLVTALEVGDVTVTAFSGKASDSIIIHIVEKAVETTEAVEDTTLAPSDTEGESAEKPDGTLETVPREEIIEAVNSANGHTPATSLEDALERSKNGQLSGYDYVPDQAPILSEYRPMKDGKYVKNTDSYYIDKDTYVVVDIYGREVFRLYRGGAYITLEEIAAYVYAFGTYPANHSANKVTSVGGNMWGKYLRGNHTRFSGNTSKYPYEPELPRISGCGGDLTYWEMDIGTTGTDCDPSYSAVIYNNGSKITRGAARIVYTWNDLNSNGMADATDVIYIFYTYNHYNDFQEYLNYYGGWGEMFGNITGGGKLSSKNDYNPTDYVPVVNGSIWSFVAVAEESAAENYVVYAWVDRRALEMVLCA